LPLAGKLKEIDDCRYWCDQVMVIDDLQQFAFAICDDFLCIQWALRSIERMTNNPETMLMKLQQYRMFLNQGVTIDYLQHSDVRFGLDRQVANVANGPGE
jgi:hypothetical protein